eukprot:Em0001g3131a
MAEQRHVSIPKPFASGDAGEWFKRFEICCKANAWDEKAKVLKLPTLLEGEALATWMELSEDEQEDYGAAKQKMIERMVPASFVSMDGFLKCRLRSGEALSLYLYELKRLLDQAMPGLDATARSPLLLHQFMEGLPTVVSKQLRAAGDVKDLDTALERARTLMTLEEGSTTVAAMEEKLREETQVQKLAHQITLLTEQVAALSDTLNDNAGKEKEMQNVFRVDDWGIWLGIVVSRETTTGRGATVNILLDSGSSISLVRKAALQVAENVRVITPTTLIQLVTAAGEKLKIVDYVTAPIQVLYNNNNRNKPDGLSTLLPIIQKAKSTSHFAAATRSQDEDVVDECAVPKFGNLVASFELPECPRSELKTVVGKFKTLFRTLPGKTDYADHYIPTTGSPVRVPPRRIPEQYRSEVEEQIKSMLQQGIIENSCSPWMAPAVYVEKKSGDIRLCVDYRELNKRTKKDAYPLPLPDEVQGHMAGATIFSTLDLQSGYWQLPVYAKDREKTAFCPGPGMGLYQFTRMPFGLTGAPSSFQHLMDTVMRGLLFVRTYIDDVIIFSKDESQHKEHLNIVFQKLQGAGLTLRGKKCHIGMDKVFYLGHTFSGAGMMPDPGKVKVVEEWPTPHDVHSVRQFLGLASYYRRYVNAFAAIAAPLHVLTQKDTPFNWTTECDAAFQTLKQNLVQAPILAYPRFDQDAGTFVLQADASAVGLGAVLEQDGHVIAYASRSLNKSEQQYSVIQKECLAVVYALKQFRHYLLGRPFNITTDHAPLQWLSAQKMEGLLCRWALAIQEYDFQIEYKKGSQNGNADALSRRSVGAITHSGQPLDDMRKAQRDDHAIGIVYTTLLSKKTPTHSGKWRQHPLRRYRQLWSQLQLIDGIVCRRYAPSPASDVISVPVLPESLQREALQRNHDAPSAGHQGIEKTLQRLKQEAFWANMAKDVNQYCSKCVVCQQAKLPTPTPAPMTNIPIGRPWKMIAVDVLAVPRSVNNNIYLLVIQDYFTKWVEAIPLPDQTANRITTEIIRLFAVYGIPDILHSDQGTNFESTIFQQTLEAFGINKRRTTAYHPQCDGMVERVNRSLLQLLRAYVEKDYEWERYLPLVLYAYRTAVHMSTGVSPFVLMFGREPRSNDLSPHIAFDTNSYQGYLQAKLAELRDFVDANMVQAGAAQKTSFDSHAKLRFFKEGDTVWLSVPKSSKLGSKWEGKWIIKSVKNDINMEITDGTRTRIVHINRLQHRNQRQYNEVPPKDYPTIDVWNAPQIDHIITSPDLPREDLPREDLPREDLPEEQRRYPTRQRRQPDRY